MNGIILSQKEKSYLEYKFKKDTIRLEENVVIDHNVISWLKTMNYQKTMFIELVGFLPKRKYTHESNEK